MNKNLIAIAVLAASALTTHVATAANGTVNFTGKIIPEGCDVTTATKNQTVLMDTIAVNAFDGAGSSPAAGSKAFELHLENCPASVTVAAVSFDGISATGDDTVLALTDGPNTATGVGIQISDAKGLVVPLHQKSSSYDLTSTGINVLKFVARYYATAATVTDGDANAVTNFTIVYP